jgi:acyl-CoA synthetase (NDP forming)
MSQASLDFLFHPRSIAVVGASNNIETHGHNHLNFQLSYGFKGEVYPINPKQTEILGRKAYPSLEAVPGTIDHVIIAVGISNIPDILTQASRKGVKSMHIYSGRASETGRPEAKNLDAEILKRAKEYGIRVLGPNALGIFCPKSGLAFGYDFPEKPGNVGAMMQSGANSSDLCHFSLHRDRKSVV